VNFNFLSLAVLAIAAISIKNTKITENYNKRTLKKRYLFFAYFYIAGNIFMELSYVPFYLQFRHPFGVSSNTRKETLSVFVKLSKGDYTGYGEACLPAYLGETLSETKRFLDSAKSLLKNTKLSVTSVMPGEIIRIGDGNNAAKAAIDMALNDLSGKTNAKPWHEMAGISKSKDTFTSFTIGIGDPEQLERKIMEAAGFHILKIKTGTPDDKALITLIRKFTEKPLYVDVNQGWTDKNYALDMLYWLHDQNVLLVEQPMPIEMKEEMRWLTQRSPLPIIADESVKSIKDLQHLDGAFSGINIKLMKCGGLGEALKMIGFCRENGLKIMLGCMAESSCGTSAMAQLMGMADYVDLDAPLLYTNDPFTGVDYREGKVCLNHLPGLGVNPRANFPVFQ
jgi:L-Ala-D/L-Glu epimerase